MRFGSVCSGIEAASVAWHHLGWSPAWLSEVDIAASAVLAHRFGASAPVYPLPKSERAMKRVEWGDQIVNWGDFTRLPDIVRRGDAEAPDLLCGGTPCQAFSLAGRRDGLADDRGQLTLAFGDLADAIDDRRAEQGDLPAIIFWENVPGVLSDASNAFGCFLALLAGDSEPVEPGPRPEHGRASAHWRWKKATGQHIPKWPNAGVVAGPRRTVAWVVKDAQYFGLAQRRRRVFVVASAREGFDPAEILFEFDGVRRDTQPSREAGEGLTHTVAPSLTGSGRGVDRVGDPRGQDPVVAYERPGGSPLICMGDAQANAAIQNDLGTTLTCTHDGPPIIAYGFQPRIARNGRGDCGDVMSALTAEAGKTGAGDSAPHVAVMPFDTTQITNPDNSARAIYGAPCHTLGAGSHPPAIVVPHSDIMVRRLMPVECERLQGFPDTWTEVPVSRKPAADGPRYKQLGNSWAVPCVSWIGQRINNYVTSQKTQTVEADYDLSMNVWLCAP